MCSAGAVTRLRLTHAQTFVTRAAHRQRREEPLVASYINISGTRGHSDEAVDIEGELAFARHGRHLVMLIQPGEEGPVTCAFAATLRRQGARLVLESLTLRAAEEGSAADPGITGEIMRAC